MRKWTIILALFTVVIVAGMLLLNKTEPSGFVNNFANNQDGIIKSPVTDDSESSTLPIVPVDSANQAPTTTIPAPEDIVDHAIKVLAVPFTPQAPNANWDMPYQEACEEASIIMLVDFVLGRKVLQLPADEADQRIVELVNWESENNYAIDITAAEVARVLRERFNIKAMAVPYSSTALKEQINLGNPVIIPAAGRLLGNPYFNQPGPLYHMLVVKGYEGDEFITNDPGTRRGESYRYQASVFDRAVHDWNGGDVENGSQVMVVIN